MAFTTCVWTSLLCSAILLGSVDSGYGEQDLNQHFRTKNSSRACYGSPGNTCVELSPKCQPRRIVLINTINFQSSSNSDACAAGISACSITGKCCEEEQYQSVNNSMVQNEILYFYEKCSGKTNCTEHLNKTNVNGRRLTTIAMDYFCIEDKMIMKFHTTKENKKQSKFVHLMYNVRDGYQNKKYSCKVHAKKNESVELYSADIRLQHSYSNSCSNTTLTLGYGINERVVVSCQNYRDYPSMTKLAAWDTRDTQDMLVNLNVKQEQPEMVWIFANASAGEVSVTCTTTDHHTYRSTEGTTHPLPSVSTSNMLSSINNGYTTELPSVTSPYGSESKLDDDETNTGAIVGGIVGAIVILASVIIGIFLWRRHQSKVTAGTKTYDNPKDVGKDNTGYEFVKPIAMPTSNGESKFSANHLSGSTDSGESGNSAYSFIKPENLAYQSAGRTGTPYCPDTVTNDSHYNYIDSNKIIVLSNSDSEGTYNHLHEPPKTVGAPSSNAYSHLKFNQGIPSSGDTDYDHIVHNKLDSPNQKASEFDDYDHIEPNGGDMNNQKNNNHSTTTDNDYEYDHLGSDNVNVQKMPSSNDYDHFSPVKCPEKRIDDDVEADVDANKASTGFTAPHQLPATKQHSTVTVFDNEVPSRRPPKCQDYELAGPLNI